MIPCWPRRLRHLVTVAAILFLPSQAYALEISDPLEDEGLVAQGTFYPTPGAFPEVDITLLTASERENLIDFAWRAQEYPTQPLYDNLLTKFVLSFSVDGPRYELTNRACGPNSSMLGVFAPGAPFSTKVACIDHALTGGEFRVSVPKPLLRTGSGEPAGFGATLADFTLVASHDAARATGTSFAEAYDDVDAGDAALELMAGAYSLGTLSLVPSPTLRLTNGAETLLMHTLDVFGAVGQDLSIRVDGLPAGWSTHSIPSMNLNSNATIPVVVSVPFAHGHGTTTGFDIIAEDAISAVDMRMHIEYLETPQPAGHHPTMWLHGREEAAGVGSERFAWMNAREDDPRDQGAPAPLAQRGGGSTESYGQFVIPLEPALLIGLDADMNSTGLAELQVLAGGVELDGRVEVAVLRCDASAAGGQPGFGQECPTGSMVEMATGGTPVQIGANQAAMVSVPLALEDAADYVPVDIGDNLFLMVRLVGGPLVFESQATQAQLGTQQGFVQLPLLEFRNHAAILSANTLKALPDWPATLAAGISNRVSIEVPPGTSSLYQTAVGTGVADEGRWLVPDEGRVEALIPVAPTDDQGVYEIAIILIAPDSGMYAVLPHMAEILVGAETTGRESGKATPFPVWVALIATALVVRASKQRGRQ